MDIFSANVFTGIIFNNTVDIESVYSDIEVSFNLKICTISPTYEFNHSSYYETEMGHHLKRVFLTFSNLISPLDGPQFKIVSQRIESRYMKQGNRTLNIDPGLLSMHNLILYSTKNYAHRIICKSGIYADLTYIFTNKNIQFLPWTYPDFKFKEIQNFFLLERERLKHLLKE